MTWTEALQQVEGKLKPLPLDGDHRAVSNAVAGWAVAGFAVRVLRGRRMQTAADVFDEFAAALQFPLYFGYNKDAFDECISDLDWIPPGKGYVLIITEPDQVLADEPQASLGWFIDALSTAADTFAQSIDSGEWWDRPPVPFHVVLAGTGDVLQAALRWAGVGFTSTAVSVHGEVGEATSALDEFLTGELNDFIRRQLLAAIEQLQAGRRYFNYNTFNVLLDADTAMATVEDELDAGRQSTIPLGQFEELVRATVI